MLQIVFQIKRIGKSCVWKMNDRELYDKLLMLMEDKDKKIGECEKDELIDLLRLVYWAYKGLNGALDKACSLLVEAVSQDCTIFDEVIEEEYMWRTEIDEWKEWCMKNG